MKKFKITYTATREFEVPDNATDEAVKCFSEVPANNYLN